MSSITIAVIIALEYVSVKRAVELLKSHWSPIRCHPECAPDDYEAALAEYGPRQAAFEAAGGYQWEQRMGVASPLMPAPAGSA